MNAATIPDELRLTAPELARRFGVIMAAIAALVARAFLRDPRYVTIIVPLWTRLNRAASRFERIMARLAAGTPSRPSRPGRQSSPSPSELSPSSPRPSEPRPFDPRLAPLPSNHAWLSSALGSDGRCHAYQLNYLLKEPGTAALIAASPQAVRLLRPLCRILGLDPAIESQIGATEKEVVFLSIGGKDLQAFFGVEGPYWVDADNDHVIDRDPGTHQIIDAETIETEIKRLAQEVAKTVTAPAQFKGGGYKDCRREFSVLAALFAVSAEYDGDVRWKDAAAPLREAAATSQDPYRGRRSLARIRPGSRP